MPPPGRALRRRPQAVKPVSYTHLDVYKRKGSGPQFYFVFRENELIGYNFLIGDTKKYKAFPWLAISNMDEQKLTVCEEMMKIQIAFFEKLGMQKIADHCVRIMEDYRKGIGKRKESDCR